MKTKFNIYKDLLVIALIFAFILNFIVTPIVIVCAGKIDPSLREVNLLVFYLGSFIILTITIYMGVDFFSMRRFKDDES